jgi:hypothetical protein
MDEKKKQKRNEYMREYQRQKRDKQKHKEYMKNYYNTENKRQKHNEYMKTFMAKKRANQRIKNNNFDTEIIKKQQKDLMDEIKKHKKIDINYNPHQNIIDYYNKRGFKQYKTYNDLIKSF